MHHEILVYDHSKEPPARRTLGKVLLDLNPGSGAADVRDNVGHHSDAEGGTPSESSTTETTQTGKGQSGGRGGEHTTTDRTTETEYVCQRLPCSLVSNLPRGPETKNVKMPTWLPSSDAFLYSVLRSHISDT